MYRLKQMKDTLVNSVQSELSNLTSADTKELAEAIDMIKDLSEAVYYCSIVVAMEKEDKEEKRHYLPYYPMTYADNNRYYTDYARDMDRSYNRMYYSDNTNGNSNGNSGGTRNYPVEIRDYREGRSPMTRRNYMENKSLHKGTPHQMQELEKYMHELSDDLTEMISDASPEEKQMMQRKLSALATKIV
jgi:tRNA C32,U32 (ribose-2'-O)-methylase TrmJ